MASFESTKRRIEYAFGIVLAVVISCATGAGQTSTTSLEKPFSTWITSAGLNVAPDSPTEIVVEEEALTSQHYRLVLEVSALPAVIGIDKAKELYRWLLQKATTLVDLPPAQVELLVHEMRGYCDGARFDVRLAWNKGQLSLEEKLIDPGGHVGCLLTFEWFKEYETNVKEGLSQLRSSTSQADASAPMNSDTAKIQKYLQSAYEKKGASVRVLASNDHLVESVVSQIRKEVITDQRYWERLQLLLLFTDVGSRTRITLVLDGKYGSGLAAPPLQSYYDMEPQYTSYLADYGKSLMTKLTEVR